MDTTEDKLRNILSKDTLQEHLTFMALFVGMYENLIDIVESRVESFLCDDYHLDINGTLKCKKTEQYRQLIEKRKVDELGNRNPLKATFLWFLDEGAITIEDYNMFIKIKKVRDKFVHQMSDFLWNGLDDTNISLLIDMLNLFCKIDKWWINEIEIPISADEIPSNYDREGVESLSLLSYKLMINVLYSDKSDKYLEMLNQTLTDQSKNMHT